MRIGQERKDVFPLGVHDLSEALPLFEERGEERPESTVLRGGYGVAGGGGSSPRCSRIIARTWADDAGEW